MKGKVIWLSGIPCSGKTTIALELLKHIDAIHLDGDTIRDTFLGSDVDFSKEGRRKHILRMGAIAKVISDQGQNVICSFVSPNVEVRSEVAESVGSNYYEFHIEAELVTCIARDVKGMYKKALAGEIKDFTGIGSDYEIGFATVINTEEVNVERCADQIIAAVGLRDNKKYSMFVGRWEGVFHNGHEHIINTKLNKGENVLLAIRDVDGGVARETKKMLEYMYKDNDKVKIITIPDIASVEYGRGVGYEVNEIKVTETVAGISGTKTREMIDNNNDEWRNFVPKRIEEYLSKKG